MAEQVSVPMAKEFAAQILTIPLVDIANIDQKVAIPEKVTTVQVK